VDKTIDGAIYLNDKKNELKDKALTKGE